MSVCTCIGCNSAFEAEPFRGYCDECVARHRAKREEIHVKQRPAPGVFADGKFARTPPRSVFNPVSERQVCGLCGSEEIEQGYGLGSGFGMGSYTFCNECYAFMDFCEDRE